MKNKIKNLIEDKERVPASVTYCEAISLDDDIKNLNGIKLVVSKDYHTYKYFVGKSGKPISRLI